MTRARDTAELAVTAAKASPTQNAITSTAYTAVLLDVGKTVTRSNAAASTHTIPAQATVAWEANTQLNFLNIGAGTVTITPAADVTINGEPLTLATSKGGSLVRTASNTWTFIPTGAAGGKVLQVVRATDSTNRSTTSTSFVDVIGMAVTITPRRTDSAVIVIVNCQTSANNYFMSVEITDSSNNPISGGQNAASGPNSNVQFNNTLTRIAYVTPATTSPVTYKMRFRSWNSAHTMEVSNATLIGQIYAIEVAP